MIKHLQDFFETSNTISTIWLGILILIDSLAILTVLISVIMFHGDIPNLIPVSYTHLDVYKRQQIYRTDRNLPPDFIK